MNDRIPELIILLSLAAVFFAWRWWTVWRIGRLYKSLAKALADSQRPQPQLDSECGFVVRLSDDSVSCQRPDGTIERVNWADLQRVDILSTADGPLLPDQFWVLVGAVGGCVIPWGATGSGELLKRLQQLPSFDNAAVISSASETGVSVKTCWRSAGAP